MMRTSAHVAKPLMLALVVAGLALAAPRPAQAACETGDGASGAMSSMVDKSYDYLTRFVIQEKSYTDNILKTAYRNFSDYYASFGKNIREALTEWSSSDWKPSLEKFTAQAHIAQIDQTYRLGRMTDAQLMIEEDARLGNHIMNARRRYEPAQLACQMDTVGPGMTLSYETARALNKGFADDNTRLFGNYAYPEGTPDDAKDPLRVAAQKGRNAALKALWDEYTTYFCDYTLGDQGCTADTVGGVPVRSADAGKHKDLGGLLWGSKKTIDPSNDNSLRVMSAALRYLIAPIPPNPIAKGGADSARARENMLARRAQLAYMNTVYNTLGSMLSERIGSAQPLNADPAATDAVNELEGAAGKKPATTLQYGPSYREMQEALTRDRFSDPSYFVNLFGSSPQVMREQTVLNALRLQTMSDIYRRHEERVFMQTAGYGQSLNSQIPKAAIKDIPLRPDLTK